MNFRIIRRFIVNLYSIPGFTWGLALRILCLLIASLFVISQIPSCTFAAEENTQEVERRIQCNFNHPLDPPLSTIPCIEGYLAKLQIELGTFYDNSIRPAFMFEGEDEPSIQELLWYLLDENSNSPEGCDRYFDSHPHHRIRSICIQDYLISNYNLFNNQNLLQ